MTKNNENMNDTPCVVCNEDIMEIPTELREVMT